MRLSVATTLLILVVSWGCATSSSDLRIVVHDDPKGPVRYKGHLAGPHDDVEELVEEACDRMVAHIDSSNGGNTSGYCALFFSAPDDDGKDKWFIGHIAPLQGRRGHEEKACALPVDLVDQTETEVLSLGGQFRPWPSTGTEAWRPTTLFNQRTGTTWSRDVLVFSVEMPKTCTVYSFIGFSRVVTARRGDDFVPIGTVYNEQGIIDVLQSRD